MGLVVCSFRNHVKAHQLTEQEGMFFNHLQLQHLNLGTFFWDAGINYLQGEKFNSFYMSIDMNMTKKQDLKTQHKVAKSST